MRHQDRRGLGRLQCLGNGLARGQPQTRVQRGEGLIQQDDRGPGSQRTGEGDTLLLPSGQFVRLPLGGRGVEFDQVEQLVQLPAGAAVRAGKAEGDVVGDAEVRKQRPFLRDVTDLASLGRDRRTGPGDHGVAEGDGAPVRGGEARDQAQQGGLAAA